jgi:type VI protein secretion system component VasK
LFRVETRDVLEHAEQAEEAAERREDFGRRAAVVVSVLAALLAISSLAGNRASTEAILAQAKASDTYNEYQANSLKRHVNLDDAAQLRILAAASPAEPAANKQADSLEQAVAEKYQPNQDELLPRAQGLEHERDLAEARHRGFQTAEAAFQLGIVLSSISIVARARWLLYAGGALGLAGVLLGANAFFLLAPPP